MADTPPPLSRSDSTCRVLWLIKGLGPGGAEQLLLVHAQSGDHETFDYRAAYLVTAKQHLVPALESAGVPVVHLRSDRPWDLRWAVGLRRLLRNERIDVVHAHSPLVAAISRLMVRSLGRSRPAHISTEHNRWPRHRASTRLANRLTLHLDDHTLAVSEGVRRTMPKRSRARTEVLEHGIQLPTSCDPATALQERGDLREEVREELGIASDATVFITVANFRREKALEHLVSAAAQVVERSTTNVVFVHVGQGPLASEIHQVAVDAHLGDSFRFLGYRTDVDRLLAAADCFALSSRHEGLPVSIMEALAAGLPVVATNVGGIPEAVNDAREGLLVPPDDVSALAAALCRMVDDVPLRDTLAAAATASAARFDAARSVTRIESIYRSASARRRR